MRPASLRLTVVPGFYFWHSDGCPHGVGRSPTYTVRPDDRGAQSHAGSRPSAPGTSLRQRWLRCPFAELPTCHSGLRLVAALQFAQQFRLGYTDAAIDQQRFQLVMPPLGRGAVESGDPRVQCCLYCRWIAAAKFAARHSRWDACPFTGLYQSQILRRRDSAPVRSRGTGSPEAALRGPSAACRLFFQRRCARRTCLPRRRPHRPQRRVRHAPN